MADTSSDNKPQGSVAELFASRSDAKRVDHMFTSESSKSTTGALLGTMRGVYLPCLQNILGVILFLRLPWIAGQAGIIQAWIVVLLCVATTVPTALSLSSIATNGKIPAGGPYYVVSRNLGPEFGGAIGILFYLGTTIAATMYVLGAVEAFQTGFGVKDVFTFDTQVFALGLMFVMALLVWRGVNIVTSIASLFLAAVLISITLSLGGVIAFGAGASFGSTDSVVEGGPVWTSEYTEDVDTGRVPTFGFLIALFYPSVTGIMAGSNRSGLLLNASKSIPIGTLAAIFTTTVLYLLTVGLFGGLISRETLLAEKLVMSFVAWPVEEVVLVGILMSSIGAGLQSLVGAPQLLKSIVSDEILPFLRFLKHDETALPVENDGPELSPPDDAAAAAVQADQDAGLQPEDVELGISQTDVDSAAITSAGARSDLAELKAAAAALREQKATNASSDSEDEGTTGDAQGAVATGSGRIPRARSTPGKAVSGGAAGWREVWMTWALASLPCLAGNLDFITPFITEFFLMMYLTINAAALLLSLMRAPSFRPKLRIWWGVSAFGVLGCLVMMFVVSWWSALIVFALVIAIYKYIEIIRHKQQWGDWGDSITGLNLEQARLALMRLKDLPLHAKNWRPQMLVMVETNELGEPTRPGLLHFAAQMKKGRGLVIGSSVIEGSPTQHEAAKRAANSRAVLQDVMVGMGCEGFATVTLTTNRLAGLFDAVQNAGLGALQPNSVLLGWPRAWQEDMGTVRPFVDFLKGVRQFNRSVLVLKDEQQIPVTERVTGTIDVWWVVHDGGLMILLPFLLTRHKLWRKCRLRIFSVGAATDANDDTLRTRLEDYLRQMRIPAELHIVKVADDVLDDAFRDRTLDMEARRKLLEQLQQDQNSVTGVLRAPPPALRGRTRRALSGLFDGLSSPSSPRAGGDESPAVDAQDGSAALTAAGDAQRPATTGRSVSVMSDIQEMNANVVTLPLSSAADRLRHAVLLNERMQELSKDARLVVTNLPLTRNVAASDFMEHVDALTQGLGSVLLVRGTGEEVVSELA